MRLVPALDQKLGRRDRWQTLGTVFDRPWARPDGTVPDEEAGRTPSRVAWFPGLSRRPRPRARPLGRR